MYLEMAISTSTLGLAYRCKPNVYAGLGFGVALSSFTYKRHFVFPGVRGLIRESQARFEKIIHRLSMFKGMGAKGGPIEDLGGWGRAGAPPRT
jgi:hypothetical protein